MDTEDLVMVSGFLVWAALILFFYFLPSVIYLAKQEKSNRKCSFYFFNLFLGWIPFVYVYMVITASQKDDQKVDYRICR